MKSALLITLCLCLPLTAGAGTVAGFGGSTEITQLLNNAELAAATGKQAAMVAEQIRTNMTAVQQYMTMVTNLKKLPAAMLTQTLAPYRQQLDDLGKIYGAVSSLKVAADGTRELFTRRTGEMNSLKLSPDEYLRAESALAAKKGGIYEQQMNADLAAIDNLQSRAEQLRQISDQVPNVSGNVEGLQLLNQQTTMLTGEMMDLKAAVLQQNAIANGERSDKMREDALAGETARRNSAEEDRRNERNQSFTDGIQFKPSWGL